MEKDVTEVRAIVPPECDRGHGDLVTEDENMTGVSMIFPMKKT